MRMTALSSVGFRYLASLIFYNPASCFDSAWRNPFFPRATLSFWVSEASYNGGGKRSQVGSNFCTYFICAVTAVTTRRCDQNSVQAKCVSDVAHMQWDAPTVCTVHQPSACRLRVSHAVFAQLAVLSMSLSFSKEPSAAEANGSNQKGPPRVSAEVHLPTDIWNEMKTWL